MFAAQHRGQRLGGRTKLGADFANIVASECMLAWFAKPLVLRNAVSAARLGIQFARDYRIEGREKHQSGEKAADVCLPSDLLSRLGAER
jgi:hypothetical protein